MLELFDLEALTRCHADDPGLAEFTKRVRSAVSAVSVRSDLKRATEMMRACEALSRTASTAPAAASVSREEAATIQALFSQAVILYCRATHSGSKGRNKLQITNHLQPDQRALHERFTGQRDRYFADYEDGLGWEEHNAVLALDIEVRMMALSYPHATAYLRQDDAEQFEQLLERAYLIAHQQQEKMSRRLNEELNGLLERRPDFLNLLRSTRFDPESFFDADELPAYLAGIGRREVDPHTDPRTGRMGAHCGQKRPTG